MLTVSEPCGPFPFAGREEDFIGECTGERWIIPGLGKTVTNVTVSLPITVIGNISIQLPGFNFSDSGKVPFNFTGNYIHHLSPAFVTFHAHKFESSCV